MSIVLDASVALSWILPDERAAGERLFTRFGGARFHAPAHWPLEVANAVVMAERRGRIDAGSRAGALRDLAELGVRIDRAIGEATWSGIPELAARRRLSGYDAAYLELAQRLDCPLASFDRALLAAAGLEKIETIFVGGLDRP